MISRYLTSGLIGQELSIIVGNPLASFLSMQEYTFHGIFEYLTQNLSDSFKHVPFIVKGPPGELLL
jgi:hypothetical protein